MSTAAQVDEAFRRVDQFLLAAGETHRWSETSGLDLHVEAEMALAARA